MGMLDRVRAWWSGGAGAPGAADDGGGFDVERFIYIKIPGHIEPLQRGAIEDRIEPALQQAELGEISGGGSQLGDARPDGSRPIEFCGIDVDATDRDAALALLRTLLPALALPDGAELHYTRGGVRLLDRLAGGGWVLGAPRTEPHPGFDV